MAFSDEPARERAEEHGLKSFFLEAFHRVSPPERLPVGFRRVVRPLTARLQFVGVRPEDVLVVSYPRSGSTWLRFLLTEILTGKPAEWDQVNRVIPDAGRHLNAPAWLPSGGRLIKTHDRYAGPCGRTIYLVRDVRDVTFSQYRRALRAGGHQTLDQHIRDTIAGKTPASRFGTWRDHVIFWLSTDIARSGDLHLIRFEDLRRDPQPILRGLLEFLELDAADSQLAEAIENNSVRRMQAKEDRALPADVAPGDPNYRWVGEGAVMGWQSKLSAGQVALLESKMGDVLTRLGYPMGAQLERNEE